MTCHHFFCIQCVNPGIPCVICSQTDVKEVGVQLRIKENENIRSVFHELSKYDFELKDTTDLENLIRSVEKVGKSTKLSSSPSKPEVVSKPENVNGIHTSKKVKNIAKRNYKGETSLHLACRKGNLDLVHELLQAGASSNVQDNAGWTPLVSYINSN